MGDPDLSYSGRSLAEIVRAGDGDAIAGFRDAHLQKVRRYCAHVCAPDRVDEACAAAFREFVARIRESDALDVDLEDELLKATRSAAAGRFERGAHAHGDVCEAMPELVAAAANGELRGEETALLRHQEECPTCAATAERTSAAERACTRATGWLPSG